MIGCVCHGLALSFSPSFVECLSTRLRTSCGAHPTVHIFLKEVVQFLRQDGFAEIPIHSRCQASLAITSHGVRGQGDHFLMDLGALFLFPNCRCCLKTVHFRHLHIHEDQIEPFFLERQKCLAPIPGYHDSMPSLFEQPSTDSLVH